MTDLEKAKEWVARIHLLKVNNLLSLGAAVDLFEQTRKQYTDMKIEEFSKFHAGVVRLIDTEQSYVDIGIAWKGEG